MIDPPSIAAIVLLGASAPLLAALLLYARWVWLEHRLTEIEPGAVYHSAAATPRALLRMVRRLRIDTVIDLRGEAEMAEAVAREQTALTAIDVRHVHLPSGQQPTPEVMRRFLALMGDERRHRRRVLIHCHHGEGRAVFFGALYRVAFHGLCGESVYARTHRLPRSLAFLAWLMPGFSRLNPRNPKSRILRRLEPHAPRLDVVLG